MANVLKRERQIAVLNLLAEGSSIRASERITGVHRDTICRLVVRFGNACREFLDERQRNLTLSHLELDEQWTFVQKKQARLTVDERAERSDVGDVYLWIAVDQETKLIPTFALGKRSADNARRFLMDIASRLDMPKPHASDDHAFEHGSHRPVVQISTDAFAAYPEAVDLAFGPYVKYGQIIKDYRNAGMQYDPGEMVGSERRAIFGIREGELRSVCTSHVERQNLTTRTFMRRFNRLTLCFSKKLENLAAAVAMYVACFNYCWQPRRKLADGTSRKKGTPAMSAKLAGHVWSFQELFDTVMPARKPN